MRQLLWKELRERGWWLGSWALATLAVVGFHAGQWWHDRGVLLTPWLMLPAMLALLAGAGRYASELHQRAGCASFLFSRPVRRTTLFAAKALTGLVVAILMPLLAGVLYKYFGSQAYRPFVTLHTILVNAFPMMYGMSILYLTGLAASTLISGMFGGMLTLMATVIFAFAAYMVLPQFGCLTVDHASLTYSLRELMQQVGICASLIVALVCAGIRIMRSGLTLGVDERQKRFVPVFMLFFFAVYLGSVLCPIEWADRVLLRWDPIHVSVSPKGTYVLTTYMQHCFIPGFQSPIGCNERFPAPLYRYFTCIGRLDGTESVRRIIFPRTRPTVDDLKQGDYLSGAMMVDRLPDSFDMINFQWINDEVGLFLSRDPQGLMLYYPATGRMVTITADLTGVGNFDNISPDGRYLVSRKMRGIKLNPDRSGKQRTQWRQTIRVIDVKKGCLLPVVRDQIVPKRRSYWWQNGHTLAFQDEQGKRGFIDLSNYAKNELH